MRTLAAAIHEKYDDTGDDDEADDTFIQVFVPKSAPHAGKGAGKPGLPHRLTLDDLQISTAGDDKDISELCGHVTELDLTKNAMTDWREVFLILENIPNLCFLNLTMNPLNDTWDHSMHEKQFPNMRDIVLNGTCVSWETISQLLLSLPNLTELHVSLNKYKTVNLPAECVHSSLTKLFVNNSQIEKWAEISKLGVAFPCLQTLNVIDSNISNFSLDGDFKNFPALTDLNISQCQMESWEEVDKFCQFPALINLRITDIPLVKDWEPKQRRQHFVARLPNIKQLNGSNVTETERDEAERAFIRYFMDSDQKPARFAELEKIHGKLDPLANVKFEKADYISLMVKFEEKEQIMDVYQRQTVGSLKKLLTNFTGLPADGMRLFHIEMCDGIIKCTAEMRSMSRQLLNFFMHEGDIIEIIRKL
ncbi:tubulin-specific chaperone cofactor E-like protein isoform X1 [Ruditapes philippinarum]|uniref:tubulin-specific chaperone cofactor E-like protein isoform X1 n=1 Tax=Ruditapes philippinarum TaxID=129788 RepID=UPI00295AB29D|nr:tubulin-specific chaperone cofactor E-like protein isoform X1 [Ruditapes philippinarum]